MALPIAKGDLVYKLDAVISSPRCCDAEELDLYLKICSISHSLDAKGEAFITSFHS